MRRRRRVLLKGVLGIAFAGAVYAVVLPRIASYASVTHRFSAVSTPWAVGLVVAAALDVVTTAPPWRVLLPQLSWLEALGFTQASTALTSVLPGGAPLGMAISFGLLKRLRVRVADAAFAVAATGVWSQVTILLYPLVGAVLVFGGGRLSETTIAIAGASGAVGLAAVVLVAAALRSRAAALRFGRALHQAGRAAARLLRRSPPDWDEDAILRLRDDRVGVLGRRWPALTAATLANQLTAYLIFELSLRGVGLSSDRFPPTETFLAWAIGRLLSSLPLTPAGVGVVELGMIGTLVGFGAPKAHVVAAVLLYRGLVIVPTLVVGAVALVALRVRPRAVASA